MKLIPILVGVALLTALVACSSDPSGLKTCNYFRDHYLDAVWDIEILGKEGGLSSTRDEAEKLNELAQDAEPEIKAAAATLLQSVIRLDEPFGDEHSDIRRNVNQVCGDLGYWEDRPPPRN